jgi:hypothetical protein
MRHSLGIYKQARSGTEEDDGRRATVGRGLYIVRYAVLMVRVCQPEAATPWVALFTYVHFLTASVKTIPQPTAMESSTRQFPIFSRLLV